MKTINLLLALAAPAMLAAGYMPDNDKYHDTNNIRHLATVDADDDGFRLCKQPYYKEMFDDKELNKLDKAEKYRAKSDEATVLAAAIQKQADDMRIISGQSSKIQKQSAKLSAKAASQELTALKTFEKAASLYRNVYFGKIVQLASDTSQASIKTARKLAEKAHLHYHAADSIKGGITAENTLESNRAIYTNIVNAVHYQELALAICKGDPKIDYTNYTDILSTADTSSKSVEIPKLIAFEHYDFDKDSNLYRLRYRQLTGKLALTEADKKTIDKIAIDEAAIADYFQKAQGKGCSADTFRVYANKADNLAVREYYEQMAQESELSECSNLLKGIKLETANNNALYEIYKKYIPAVRTANTTVGTYRDRSAIAAMWEQQAENLYQISKTYEELAAKQLSHVEQYTQLSEGNEAKLQALQYIENAIAAYVGDTIIRPSNSLAATAIERHNDIAMDFMMDESGDGPAKPATTTSKTTTTKTTTPANTVVDVSGNTTTTTKATTTTKPTTTTTTTTNPATTTTTKPSTTTKTTTAKTTTVPVRQPAITSSNAAVTQTSYYTRDDQRLKPYKFPTATIFSVEAGIYKEMPEPVEFPSVQTFLAQNLKGQTFMRYYIGTFKTYDAALAAQAMAKDEGYTSSKVVAFTNGKKVDLTAARKTAEKAANYQSLVQTELKALNANRKATTPVVVSTNTTNATGSALPLSMLGNAYAVQIAALPKLLGADAFNVSELYYDQNDAGLYRYYTGISDDMTIANANLTTLRQSGYEDAYLVQIANGVHIGSATAKATPSATTSATVYRVQIGAFAGNPNPDTQKRINTLKSSGHTVHTSQSGKYTVYTVGDCATRDQAETLKRQLVNKGFKESYVATFVNGVKQN